MTMNLRKQKLNFVLVLGLLQGITPLANFNEQTYFEFFKFKFGLDYF